MTGGPQLDLKRDGILRDRHRESEPGGGAGRRQGRRGRG